MSADLVTMEVRERVATITLDDGGPNALTTEVFNGLFDCLDAAESDEGVGSVVLAGRDGFFSAGINVKWLDTLSREQAGTIGPDMARLTKRIFVFPKPVIAAVRGHAIAGGAVLLLACDRSVGVTGDYKVGLSEVDVGIPFGGFGLKLAQAHLVPSAFGVGLMHGEAYTPEGAREVGYLDELAAPEDFDARVREIAERAAGLSGFAYTITKMGIRGELAEEIQEAIDSGMLEQLFQAFADFRRGAQS